MDLSAWVAYTFMAALAMAASLVHYHLREPRGAGRIVVGLLRGAALATIVLLLFDPVVPTPGGSDPMTVALVDASLSMSLPRADGATRWEEAQAALSSFDPDRIQLFGTDAGRTIESVQGVEPSGVASRLAPALRAAMEAGADRVVIVTDGALEDAGEARRMAAEGGVAAEVRLMEGETRANLGLESVEAPGWVEAGEEAVVRATVARVGGAGAETLPDSVALTLSQGERELARTTVPVPAVGQTSTAELQFRIESTAGPVRLDVGVTPGGAMEDDDTRSVYVRVAAETAGVVLVSFRPDQEPRFLLPVLERTLGLPVRGWISLAGDRFLSLGSGSDAGMVTPPERVRRAVSEAGLLVLHGLGAEAPAWARAAADESERVLVFPSDPRADLAFAVPAVQDGEWYPAQEIPSSPVAPLMAGAEMASAPPLTGLRPMPLPGGFWTPLEARLGRRGEPYPVLAVGRDAGRRLAVALGTGYWRWAFAGAEGRELYERLWAAVGGWLMADLEGLEREIIRPVDRVVARGAAMGWTAPAGADSLRILLERESESEREREEEAEGEAGEALAAGAGAVLDTTVVVERGRAVTSSLLPGHYRYTARAIGAGGQGGQGEDPAVAVVDSGEGVLTVESYSAELLHETRLLEGMEGGGTGRAAAGAGRPLHTTPWPYIVVIVLLCAEWVLRRRWGLR